jgi:ubiquinone/menaquinone biosynthesis C-methylase UbiE
MDPEEYRRGALANWERAAGGWRTRRAEIQEMAAPVSEWMVEAIAPQPGQTILELAAGPGDTGMMAAEGLRPGGKLISSDMAEGMLEVARERAQELGLDDVVEVRRLQAEWIDLPTASVDAVLCRWGYMLLADPEAALRETRRVLRPGGRLALGAWASAAENPWASLAADEVARRLGQAPPEPGTPGMFAFGAPGRIEELLEATGFTDPTVEGLDLRFEHPSFEHWWESRLELSVPFADAVSALAPEQVDELRELLGRELEPYAGQDGGLSIPARALVASAHA